MDWLLWILSALVGYLLGSISFARVITRMVNPEASLDQARTVTAEDGQQTILSGIGAYTTSMALGSKYGGFVALFDILKAFLPVLVFRLLYPDQAYALVCSLFTVLGHNFPVYYNFQGGRGLSPMMGGLLVLDPFGYLVSTAVGLLLGILINQPATGMLLWMPLLTLWALIVRADWALTVYSVLLIALLSLANLPEFKTIAMYRKQGRLDEYNAMVNQSSSMMRMFQKLSAAVRFWER